MSILLDALLKEKLIDCQQVTQLRKEYSSSQKHLIDLLLEMKCIDEEELVKVLSRILCMPIIELSEDTVDPDAVKTLSYDIAKRYHVLPVRRDVNSLVVAVSNPMDIIALDSIRLITTMKIEPMLSTHSEIARCIEKYYHGMDATLKGIFNEDNGTSIERVKQEDAEVPNAGMFNLKELHSENSPAVKLTKFVMGEAIRHRASDVHIEPQEKYVDVRIRVDGVLRSLTKIPNRYRAHIAAHIKILTDLDIAESRKPQDGRVRIATHGRKIDLRVSVIPTF
ncbi:GspE/PulE family protein, partial [Candidatus Omnitrophota bacterium]